MLMLTGSGIFMGAYTTFRVTPFPVSGNVMVIPIRVALGSNIAMASITFIVMSSDRNGDWFSNRVPVMPEP